MWKQVIVRLFQLISLCLLISKVYSLSYTIIALRVINLSLQSSSLYSLTILVFPTLQYMLALSLKEISIVCLPTRVSYPFIHSIGFIHSLRYRHPKLNMIWQECNLISFQNKRQQIVLVTIAIRSSNAGVLLTIIYFTYFISDPIKKIGTHVKNNELFQKSVF